MSQLKNMSILFVVAFAAAILESTEAADHTVGGTTGWSVPSGASFYSDWAASNTFKQNDVLVFNFAGGHTVAEVSKADFDNCNINQNGLVITTGPARVTLNRTGDFYFICTIQGHCSNGQKLSVKVSASTPSPPSPTPPTSTPPTSTPPTSGTTPTPPTNGGTPSPSSPTGPDATPPSPGSATTLVATFPVLIAVIMNLLV